MKTIYMPNVTSANELFTSIAPWNHKAGDPAPTVIKRGREHMTVGTYCRIVGRGEGNPFPRQSVSAVPSPALLAWIRKNVLFVESDTLSFEILVQVDSNCLVVLSHGQIIGSYWLTDSVRVETLPAFVVTQKKGT